MTCKYKVKIKDIQYNYKVQMTDIQSKYKFKVFCTGYDDSEIKEKIDAMYQAWPKVSGEGETITLNDTVNTTMAIDLKGNTSQETTTGKNKLPYPYTQTSITSNGVTYTAQSDGSVLVNGTSTGTSTIKLYGDYQEINNLDVPGKYLTGGTSNVILRAYNHTGNSYTPLANDNGNGAEIDTSTYSKCYIELYVVAGTTVNNERIYPMVVDSLSDRTYEKYTNGASPNPNYPQTISNVTGTNTIKINGKNLFDKDNVIVGKVYNSNGELVNSRQWNTNNDFEKVNENKVSISCKTTGTVNSLLIEFDENKNFIQRQQVIYISSSLTLNTNTKYIRYCYQNTLGMYDIQIEENSTATTYEAYKEQSYTINLGSIELCKIGDYQDRIYKDNGKWYLNKQIGKYVISGNEETRIGGSNFATMYSNGNIARIFDIINMLSSNNREYTCSNNFSVVDYTLWNAPTIGIQCYQNAPRITISAPVSEIEEYYGSTLNVNNYATVYVNYLAHIGTYFLYVLATPTTEEITDSTLISQLEEIKEAESYSGQTNISQTNDDKPFILTATALKDLSSL